MANTQRTRAALLALLADNVTGQISEQDFRDFLVTVMQEEFVHANDFWCSPTEYNNTTDETTRGDHLYSQIVSSVLANGMSFGVVYNKNQSNIWSTADVVLSANNYFLGLPAFDYAANASNAKMLRRGVVCWASISVAATSNIGYPLYLGSTGDLGAVCVQASCPTNSRRIGYVLPSGQGESYGQGSRKFFFDANWDIPRG